MRRRRAERRGIQPDRKHNSEMVGRFVNIVMSQGKKTIAEKIVYGALDLLGQKTQEDSLKAFNKAVENTRPRLEVRPRRVGGATYQIPIEVSTLRGHSLAMRWMRDLAMAKKGKPMVVKLADELLAAYKGEGAAIKKRDETHKMADANKAFMHLRW